MGLAGFSDHLLQTQLALKAKKSIALSIIASDKQNSS
jgi:hypothetical protein